MSTQLSRNIEALDRRAEALEAKAEAVLRTYNSATWIRFVPAFFPMPFVVVLFRLQLDAWHYYVAGAKRDTAAAEAERARSDCEAARSSA